MSNVRIGHRHDMPYATVRVEEIGKVQICRKCGVARKKIGGVFHYYSSFEHLGIGIWCGAGTWQLSGRGFNQDGSIKSKESA